MCFSVSLTSSSLFFPPLGYLWFFLLLSSLVLTLFFPLLSTFYLSPDAIPYCSVCFLSFIIPIFPLFPLFLSLPSILHPHPPIPIFNFLNLSTFIFLSLFCLPLSRPSPRCSPSVLCLCGTRLLEWAASNLSVICQFCCFFPLNLTSFLFLLLYLLDFAPCCGMSFWDFSVLASMTLSDSAFLTILQRFLFLIFSSLFFPTHFLLPIFLSSVSVCSLSWASFVTIHQSFFSPLPSTYQPALPP